VCGPAQLEIQAGAHGATASFWELWLPLVLKISEYVTLTAKRKCHPPSTCSNKGSIRHQVKIGG
jgi:hypothetical protein